MSPIILSTWPTPVEPAPRLAQALGLGRNDLWIKRDDLTGLGGGGNKIRKLQYTCAQAMAEGATTLITSGAPQSNHARLTAAAAARLGLRCVLVLKGEQPQAFQGNLLLNQIADAGLVWTDASTPGELQAAVDAATQDVTNNGGVPYVIPFGGSSSYSARGYSDCAAELILQLPDLDHVVVALGSGGTMAGLVAQLGPERVIGVDCGAIPDPVSTVGKLLDGMPDKTSSSEDLRIVLDQVGDGYATLTPAARQAILLAARTEGLFLDPTYTARAFAGLVELAASGSIRRGQRTVFMHTGGLPGIFGHPSVATLR